MDSDRMEVFLEKYREVLPEYIRELERHAVQNEVPIIRRGTRDVLRFLLRTVGPAEVLEVGAAIGYSALCMKEFLPAASHITTIEKVEMRLAEAKKNLKKYDPEKRITLLEGDAADVLERLVQQGKSYDFIFMDAAKGQYLNFLPNIRKLLRDGGLLVSDNILHEGDILESRYAVTRRDRTIHSRMREYLQVLMDTEELETICVSVGDGMTLSRKMNSLRKGEVHGRE